MSEFPSPVLPPPFVHAERMRRNEQIVRSATIGMWARLAIIIFELIGVFWMNSSVLFMDAMHSLLDLLSTLLLLYCIRLANRPPDEDHPFGHGRYEPLGGSFIGILLMGTGGILVVQQVIEIFRGGHGMWIHPLAWIFPLVALLLMECSYHYVRYVAKQSKSTALMAEAYHYRLDAITSLFATIALLVASSFPLWGYVIDHIGAVVIAAFMIGLGYYATKSNLHQLMDRVPEEWFFERIRNAAGRVEGVKGTEKIRIQSYGPDAHVDIDVEVDPSLSVELAHRISQLVRAEIQKEWSSVRDVTVHIEPYYENDH